MVGEDGLSMEILYFLCCYVCSNGISFRELPSCLFYRDKWKSSCELQSCIVLRMTN
jgi:hypothetical protein